MRSRITFLFLLCFLTDGFAFQDDNDKVSLRLQDTPLRTALKMLSEQIQFDIVFSDELVEGISVTCDVKDIPLEQALQELLSNKPIKFQELANGQIVLFPSKTQQWIAIRGNVVDDRTKLPLGNVNVFLSHTMMGDATNKKGEFIIENVPRGRFYLVASRIGYAVQKQEIITSGPIGKTVFRLTPQPYQAPTLEISAAEMKVWQKDLKKFKELFFGKSRNASECTILNPEVLDFEKKSRFFKATANAPLQIVNRSLGYLIHFIIEEFSLENDALSYLGLVRIEELSHGGPEEKKKWQRNRITAYNGSLRHFLSSLFNGRLEEEGFLLYEISALPKKGNNPYRTKIIGRSRLYYVGSPFDENFGFERELRFDDYWEVIYVIETEEKGYVDHKLDRASAFWNIKQRASIEPHHQRSWIAIDKEKVIVDNFGHLNDPRALKSHGYWAWEQLAEMLPLEYHPAGPTSLEFAGSVKPRAQDLPDMERTNAPETSAWQDSLDALRKSISSSVQRGRPDPRLAVSFIELVTAEKAREHYKEACELYYWGFSKQPIDAFKNDISAEIERISPLLEDNEIQEWRTDLNSDNTDVLAKIKTFWLEKDPTPTTILNERLIEHYERITYARKSFKENDNSVYGTDDRGLIYVKYGAPDRERVVTLGANSIEIYNVANEMDIRYGMGDFRSEIQQFINFPKCEVWAYPILGQKGFLVFLFGRKEGKAPYGLRTGVEEFIQDIAFRRKAFGVVIGSVIQLVYYSALMGFDMSFASRTSELDNHLGDLAIQGKGKFNAFTSSRSAKALNSKFESLDLSHHARKLAEPQRSDVEKSFTSIHVTSTPVRFLGQDNTPYLFFVAFAFAPNVTDLNPEKLQKVSIAPDYRTRFTLLVRNDNLEEIKRLAAKPIQTFDNTAFVKIQHENDQAHYTLVAETFGLATPVDSLDQSNPVAVGTVFLKKIDRLDPRTDKLEVSDLVIGIEPPGNIHLINLPFDLLPTQRIWKTDVMKGYFEVYHLDVDTENIGRFDLDCRIFRLEGKKRKRNEMIATTFDFYSFGSSTKENFAISIDNLGPGNYEMEIEITDKISGQTKQRIAPFQVMEEK